MQQLVEKGLGAAVEIGTDLRAVLGELDMALYSGADCAAFAEEMARVEKAVAATRAMAAARAANCGVHKTAGFNSAEEWLARMTGASAQQARSELVTGSRLADCDATREAATAGELSLGQAAEITRTEVERPGSEGDLIATARNGTRKDLSEHCRERREEGLDRAAIAAKQRAARNFRSFTDSDGMVSGRFALEPIHGVPLMNRLSALTDRLHRAERAAGSTDTWSAHAADAFVALLDAGLREDEWDGDDGDDQASKDAREDDALDLASGVGVGAGVGVGDPGQGRGARRSRKRRGGKANPSAGGNRKADVVFVVDLETFRSGERPDSLCHMIGGGPVPVEVVREISRDAFLKVAFTKGKDMHTVTHFGRYIPVELRTALELGPGPKFNGVRCVDCGNIFRLEWDHDDPICNGGVTSYDNEKPRCKACHRKKCEAERAAGLYDRWRHDPARGAPAPAPAEDDMGDEGDEGDDDDVRWLARE